VALFQKARGRRLAPLECHDLVCKVAEIVVVGGVRR
jgi:ribonucleoside-diphosphate reductase alpha chain